MPEPRGTRDLAGLRAELGRLPEPALATPAALHFLDWAGESLRELRLAIALGPPISPPRRGLGERLALGLVLATWRLGPEDWRAGCPGGVEPAQPEERRARLLADWTETLEFHAPEVLRRAVLAHPRLGPLDAWTWLRLQRIAARNLALHL